MGEGVPEAEGRAEGGERAEGELLLRGSGVWVGQSGAEGRVWVRFVVHGVAEYVEK